MTFLSPARLLILVVPLLLMAALLLVRARRSRTIVRFTALDLVDQVAPVRPGWRRVVTRTAVRWFFMCPDWSLCGQIRSFATPTTAAFWSPPQRSPEFTPIWSLENCDYDNEKHERSS